MSIWICSTTDGGCGFIGHYSEFEVETNSSIDWDCAWDEVNCPSCSEDHCFQITKENLVELTNEVNRVLAEQLLKSDDTFVGIAQCGCVHHAENGEACSHDVALVRERYYATTITA